MANEVHVNGRLDIFLHGFSDEVRNIVFEKFDSENSDIMIALIDNAICGLEIIDYIEKPKSPYNFVRKFLHINI